jgi:hypothetical protein
MKIIIYEAGLHATTVRDAILSAGAGHSNYALQMMTPIKGGKSM